MIPKIIHYCWFGRGPMPELALKCIESWKQFCPDYTLVEWNEDNFDVQSNQYVKEAYEARKFAFVTDYVRLYAMYTQGGIYMDTDVMVLKNLDGYLHHQAFSGFESKTKVPTGIMASEKGQALIGEMLSYYDTASFLNEDGSFDMTTNVEVITALLLEKGLIPNGEYQEIAGMTYYPKNVFCPEHKRLGDETYMKDSATIHYFSGSWKSTKEVNRRNTWWWKHLIVPASKLSRILEKVCGKPYSWIKEHLWRRTFGE